MRYISTKLSDEMLNLANRSDSLHTFPGSSVIVREEEPSSIIASALRYEEHSKA